MSSLITVTTSLRLPMLLFSIPYVWMWMESSGRGPTGWLMVLLHASLLLFYCTSFDRAVLTEGHEPRLALTRDRMLFNTALIERARVLTGAVAVASSIAMIALNWRLGVLGLIVLGLILVLTAGLTTAGARRRFVLAEVLWPLVVLVGPATLVASQGWNPSELPEAEETVALHFASDAPVPAEATDPTPPNPAPAPPAAEARMSTGVILATILGGLLLAVYVMACLVRDEIADKSLRLWTVSTALGRGPAAGLLMLALCGAVLLAAWGGHVGAWHWLTTPFVGWTAVAVGALLTQRMDEHAVTALWAGHGAVALTLLASVA